MKGIRQDYNQDSIKIMVERFKRQELEKKEKAEVNMDDTIQKL